MSGILRSKVSRQGDGGDRVLRSQTGESHEDGRSDVEVGQVSHGGASEVVVNVGLRERGLLVSVSL